MLNYEYARLVELDRRRTIAERIRIERALHPADGSPDQASGRTQTSRTEYAVPRGVTSTAR